MIFKGKSNVDYLVVCLGNPGLKYDNTRHNVGFAAGDFILEHYNVKDFKKKFNSLLYTFKIEDKRIALLKPETFMNLSGIAVKQACNYYKINAENVIIIQDDIAIDIGKIRVKRKGSHGGQNGIKNIIENLQTDNFMRVKIGVGDKPHKDYDLASWVLSKFTHEEQEIIKTSLTYVRDAIKIIVCEDIQKAMNSFN